MGSYLDLLWQWYGWVLDMLDLGTGDVVYVVVPTSHASYLSRMFDVEASIVKIAPLKAAPPITTLCHGWVIIVVESLSRGVKFGTIGTYPTYLSMPAAVHTYMHLMINGTTKDHSVFCNLIIECENHVQV